MQIKSFPIRSINHSFNSWIKPLPLKQVADILRRSFNVSSDLQIQIFTCYLTVGFPGVESYIKNCSQKDYSFCMLTYNVFSPILHSLSMLTCDFLLSPGPSFVIPRVFNTSPLCNNTEEHFYRHLIVSYRCSVSISPCLQWVHIAVLRSPPPPHHRPVFRDPSTAFQSSATIKPQCQRSAGGFILRLPLATICPLNPKNLPVESKHKRRLTRVHFISISSPKLKHFYFIHLSLLISTNVAERKRIVTVWSPL